MEQMTMIACAGFFYRNQLEFSSNEFFKPENRLVVSSIGPVDKGPQNSIPML